MIHDTLYRESTGSWDHGKLSDEGYTVFPNSSITAMYNQCRFCANTTIIAFQDINGFVQVGNLTSSGWSLSQLGNGMQPAVGTGLALQPFYRANTSDQVNLYYQKDGELNMTLAAYQESHPENSGQSPLTPSSDCFLADHHHRPRLAFQCQRARRIPLWVSDRRRIVVLEHHHRAGIVDPAAESGSRGRQGQHLGRHHQVMVYPLRISLDHGQFDRQRKGLWPSGDDCHGRGVCRDPGGRRDAQDRNLAVAGRLYLVGCGWVD